MFDIGFPELVLIAIVGLLVIGPERLPEVLRTLGLWLGRMRRSFVTVKAEIEKEIGMDEVRRQLHNEAIMEEMKRIESEVKKTADMAQSSLNEGAQMAESAPPGMDPQPSESVSDLLAEQDGMPFAGPTDTLPLDFPAPETAGTSPASESAEPENPPRSVVPADRDHADAADEEGHLDAADDRDHSDAADEPRP